MNEPRSDVQARLDEIVERLRPMQPIRILFFGSAARGTADWLSDLNVIVVAERVAPHSWIASPRPTT